MKRHLENNQFPRSNTYDRSWIFENEMGPNALWLTEFLCERMTLKPGMRVLDMGCGKALSSIFLAREFGVKVVANDLWITPSENWERIKQAGLENEIIPISAEANALPYADGYFDAAVSIDSFHYYGQSTGYIAYFAKFIRQNGFFGISHIALKKRYEEIDFADIPEYLVKWYRGNVDGGQVLDEEVQRRQIFTIDEWVERIDASGRVRVLSADLMKDGCRNHVRFLEEMKKAGYRYRAPQELDEWKFDDGGNFGFLGIVGQIK